MDNRSEIRDFLATRRARISPEQVGLLPGAGRRRVPGLRREEVAVLAGVSTDWYTRLEKGHIAGVSEDVLTAVARALHLDDAEQAHLFDLARAARPHRTTARRRRTQAYPRVRWMLDTITGSPAIALNGRMDILAANDLGRAFCSPVLDDPRWAGNIARFQFLDDRARDFHPDWSGAANTTVALLRTEAGRDPHNEDLRGLVGELSTLSQEFRTRWAAHDVRIHRTGVKTFRHPVVGLLEVVFHTVPLPTEDDGELRMTVYTAEPGSPAEDGLTLLASWAATRSQPMATPAGGDGAARP